MPSLFGAEEDLEEIQKNAIGLGLKVILHGLLLNGSFWKDLRVWKFYHRFLDVH